MKKARLVLGALALAVVASACSSSSNSSTAGTGGSGPHAPAGAPTITIGSVNFPEAVIVANLYADVLEHAGYKVDLRTNLGNRQAVVPALQAGQLDLEPDYAGSLLVFLDKNDTQAATQTSTAIPALKSALAKSGATVLDPSNALDTNVFAVTKATASKYHLTTISSLKPVAGKLILGGPPECPSNYGCLVGLQSVYGLHFSSFKSLDEAGPITVAALKNGEVQVAELFSSDGNVLSNGFVQLTDDKHLEPADYIIPVIRTSVATPTVSTLLNNLSAKLTTDDISRLNLQVTDDHESEATVAKTWATQQGLI